MQLERLDREGDTKRGDLTKIATLPQYVQQFRVNFLREAQLRVRSAARSAPGYNNFIKTYEGNADAKQADWLNACAEFSEAMYRRIDFSRLTDTSSREEDDPYVHTMRSADGGSHVFINKSLLRDVLISLYNELVLSKLVRDPFFGAEPFFQFVFVRAFMPSVQSILDSIYLLQVSPSEIASAISDSAKNAPIFRQHNGRLRYRQSEAAKGNLAERKAVAQRRCEDLLSLCAVRANEQPELKRLSESYYEALRSLKRDRGVYRLHLAGLDIETLLRIRSELPPDPDRNPPLDGDLLSLTQSLIIAHAGLVALYPAAEQISEELDRFRMQSESIDALRERILDPVVSRLAQAEGIFDDQTRKLTRDIAVLAEVEARADLTPSRAVTSTKVNWLRGAMAGIGSFILRNSKRIAGYVASGIFGNYSYDILKQPESLAAGIAAFIITSQPFLLAVADALQSTFGWIRPLLSLVGL